MPMLTDIFRRGSPAIPRPRIPTMGARAPAQGYGGETLTGAFGSIKPPPASPTPTTDTTPGKTDWWSLMIPLIAAGAGAAFGGKRGALAGGVAALQGMAAEKQTRAAVEKAQREEEKAAREEQQRLQKEEKEEEERKKTARQQATISYALRKVQTPGLHPDDKAAIDKADAEEMERKKKEQEEKDTKERQRELDREARAEEREREREGRSEGRKKKEKELEKSEKEEEPPKPTDIKSVLEYLKNEKEEIEKTGTYPKDAQGKIVMGGKKAFTTQQQARLDEIGAQVTRLRAAQTQSVLTKLGKARGKAKTDSTEVLPQEEIGKLKEAIRIYREKGLTNEEIRQKMTAVPDHVLKMLGL